MAYSAPIYDEVKKKKKVAPAEQQEAKKGDRKMDPYHGEVESTGDEPTDDFVSGSTTGKRKPDGAPQLEWWHRTKEKKDEKAVPTS